MREKEERMFEQTATKIQNQLPPSKQRGRKKMGFVKIVKPKGKGRGKGRGRSKRQTNTHSIQK
jgi:hypothetical protein